MILVDSSVWIDYFRGVHTARTDFLNDILGREAAAVGDLIITEVLQGFQSPRDFNDALRLMSLPQFIEISDRTVAIRAARNFRHLRGLGITVRKTIDTLIATRCIADGIELLYSDRDFDPFVVHFGLRAALS